MYRIILKLKKQKKNKVKREYIKSFDIIAKHKKNKKKNQIIGYFIKQKNKNIINLNINLLLLHFKIGTIFSKKTINLL